MASNASPAPPEWVLVAPVRNVQLTLVTDHELRLGRLTLVTLPRLKRCRRRLGLPHRIADLKKSGALANFFDSRRVYAVARSRGTASDAAKEFERLATEGLTLLTLSQLGISRRRHAALPSLGQASNQAARYCSNTIYGRQRGTIDLVEDW